MCNNVISLLRYVEVRNISFVVTSIINSVELALSGARTITIFVNWTYEHVFVGNERHLVPI